MINGRIFFYRVMRDLVELVWPNPDWWFYWDRKVLAERAKAKTK